MLLLLALFFAFSIKDSIGGFIAFFIILHWFTHNCSSHCNRPHK